VPQVEITVKLPFSVKKKEKYYVSCCPVLDVYSQGETQEKAVKNLVEALRVFITSCFERGTLDEVLKACGFKADKKAPRSSRRRNVIDVPVTFNVKNHCSTACHV
jgi:predicted RNase H-like HicB family nuclease